ncbi:unnamed protein product [Symbiodinium sp. KB8]|nr:unnamed protein product [Symbiodinium sp. KB8]
MRDEMKYKEQRIKAIKEYCEARAAQGYTGRYDKYEKKTKYWVEEDLEFEWEKSKQESVAENAEYQVQDSDGTDLMTDPNATMNFDLTEAALGRLLGASRESRIRAWYKFLAMGKRGCKGPGPAAGPSGSGTGGKPDKPAANTLLPTVLKNELPSTVIVQYLSGITKRVNKMQEMKEKYEAIDDSNRSRAHSQIVVKCDEHMSALEKIHDEAKAKGKAKAAPKSAAPPAKAAARKRNWEDTWYINFIPTDYTETAQRFYENLQQKFSSRMDDSYILDLMLDAQFHNSKTSTYRTRMLHTLLPKLMYTKARAHVFDTWLDQLREDATALLEDGIAVSGHGVYYPVCVAFKGDAPMITKAGYLSRAFHNLGNPCCWECLAGGPLLPFEDCGRRPCWEPSMYTERPWHRPSPIAEIPAFPDAAERIFRKDPFHIYKQSVGGSFVASSLILMLDLGYYAEAQNNGLDALLGRAYEDFAFFVKHEWTGSIVPFIKHFTKTNLHYPRADAYPYARLKGSDIMLLTRWLAFLMEHGPRVQGARIGSLIDGRQQQRDHQPFMRHIARAATGAIAFFHIMHTYGLWHPREVAQQLGEAAFAFTDSYSYLAEICHRRSLNRFSLVPSLHYMHHFWVDVRVKLEDPSAKWFLSPVIGNSEPDEDYIGKICRLSRRVHPKRTAARTIDRFLIKMHFVLHEGSDG